MSLSSNSGDGTGRGTKESWDTAWLHPAPPWDCHRSKLGLRSSPVVMSQECWVQRQIMDKSCLHMDVHL